jgi:hypothetical protein
MSHRYKVRVFEGGDQDGSIEAGTIVLPLDRVFSLFARTAQEAEAKVQSEVAAEKLAWGCVYQICPPFGNPESIRAFSVDTMGNCQRTYLDPASGIFSEFRRIRYQDLRVNMQREEATELQQVIC